MGRVRARHTLDLSFPQAACRSAATFPDEEPHSPVGLFLLTIRFRHPLVVEWPLMDDVAYKIFGCPQGHRWDVYGVENEEGAFVPDDLRTYLCPTCDEVMVDELEPENLT